MGKSNFGSILVWKSPKNFMWNQIHDLILANQNPQCNALCYVMINEFYRQTPISKVFRESKFQYDYLVEKLIWRKFCKISYKGNCALAIFYQKFRIDFTKYFLKRMRKESFSFSTKTYGPYNSAKLISRKMNLNLKSLFSNFVTTSL